MKIPYLLIPALVLALAIPSQAKSPERRLQKLIEEEKWLTAGELAQELIGQNPENAKVRRQFEILEQKVRRDAENLDFDPKRYFYAQSYIDYFKRQRYAEAVDDMEQVLIFELENEEVLRFMDKAQLRGAEELKVLLEKIPGLYDSGKYPEALDLAQRALALDSSNASAKDWTKKIQLAMAPPAPPPEEAKPAVAAAPEGQVAMTAPPMETPASPPPQAQAETPAPPQEPEPAAPEPAPAPQPAEEAKAPPAPVPQPEIRPAPSREPTTIAMLPPQARTPRPKPQALPPPDPDWLESQYREALKAYVHRDLSKSQKILREMLARDPGNDRWQKTLQRIEKELPQ